MSEKADCGVARLVKILTTNRLLRFCLYRAPCTPSFSDIKAAQPELIAALLA